jgi:iron complex transport system substrate-binding protein
LKKFFFLLIFILLTAIPSGCVNREPGNFVTVTDMLGREIKIPEKVERVVGIEAGALRLLVYMQVTDKVVGIEEHEKQDTAGGMAKPYILANPDLMDLPSVGPIHGGDAELIVAAEPDVIFWTSTERGKADDLQRKTGIPVVALVYGDLNDGKDDLYRSLDLIGEVTGNPSRASEVQDFIDQRIEDLNSLTRDTGLSPDCYVGGIGYRGSQGLLSTEPSYSSLDFINGNNVAHSLGFEHAFIDKEKILDWDPEVIIVDEGGLDLARNDLGEGTYDSVDAIEKGRVYGVLPYNWYTTNFGTVLGNSYYLAKVLFPEDTEDLDPVVETDDIYEFMVGDRVYRDMADSFGGFMELDV